MLFDGRKPEKIQIVNMHNLTKTNEYSVILMSITYFMQIIRVLLKLVQTHRHVGSLGRRLTLRLTILLV